MNTSQINFGAEPHGKTRYEEAVAALLRARREGASLREAAEAAGVHVATVCRWQNRDPAFREALSQALQESFLEFEEDPRPSVRWRRDCPLCKAKVVVRSARGKGPLLALWPLAGVPVGQLAAAGIAGLPALWRTALLVPQPPEHRL